MPPIMASLFPLEILFKFSFFFSLSTTGGWSILLVFQWTNFCHHQCSTVGEDPRGPPHPPCPRAVCSAHCFHGGTALRAHVDWTQGSPQTIKVLGVVEVVRDTYPAHETCLPIQGGYLFSGSPCPLWTKSVSGSTQSSPAGWTNTSWTILCCLVSQQQYSYLSSGQPSPVPDPASPTVCWLKKLTQFPTSWAIMLPRIPDPRCLQ